MEVGLGMGVWLGAVVRVGVNVVVAVAVPVGVGGNKTPVTVSPKRIVRPVMAPNRMDNPIIPHPSAMRRCRFRKYGFVLPVRIILNPISRARRLASPAMIVIV